MRNAYTGDVRSYKGMSSAELRGAFLVESLFRPGSADFVYTDVDRAVAGGIVPLSSALTLEGGRELASEYFLERREAGIINLGGAGTVSVDGTAYPVKPRECLYVGRGSREIVFTSESDKSPAMFYMVSYPAHAAYPVEHSSIEKANRVELGSAAQANRRTIYQYIRPGRIKSCQLVMGFTELHEGSVWNTFPPHTHGRRSEVYCYFDLQENGNILHLMGTPEETRHLAVRNRDVVLSPSWSIHSGVGTGAYRFVWAMGGENQVFEDMDAVNMESFR